MQPSAPWGSRGGHVSESQQRGLESPVGSHTRQPAASRSSQQAWPCTERGHLHAAESAAGLGTLSGLRGGSEAKQEKEVASQCEVMGPLPGRQPLCRHGSGCRHDIPGQEGVSRAHPDWRIDLTGWHGHPLVPETPSPGKACRRFTEGRSFLQQTEKLNPESQPQGTPGLPMAHTGHLTSPHQARER